MGRIEIKISKNEIVLVHHITFFFFFFLQKKNSSSFYLMNIYQVEFMQDLSFIVYKDAMK